MVHLVFSQHLHVGTLANCLGIVTNQLTIVFVLACVVHHHLLLAIRSVELLLISTSLRSSLNLILDLLSLLFVAIPYSLGLGRLLWVPVLATELFVFLDGGFS